MAGMGLIIVAFLWSFISLILLIILIALFGKLMILQLKLWMLAKKGFFGIEHIGEDKVKRVYYMRVKDSHFDIKGGVYMLQKDAIIKAEALLKKPETKIDKKNLDALEAQQVNKLYGDIKKLKFNPDAVILNWGIPTLVYYGNDPHPVFFADRKKIYDSKVISAYIYEILMTKSWKLIQMAIIIGFVAIGLSLLAGYLYYMSVSKANTNVQTCLNMVNTTYNAYITCVNQTAMMTGQNMSQMSIITI